MRVKSRYKVASYAQGGAVVRGAEEVTAVPPSSDAVEAAEVALPASAAPAPEDDSASSAFASQISALAKAESAAALKMLSPQEQKLRTWVSQGLSEQQANFLRSNPAMIDRHEITAAATALADQDGYGVGHDQHYEIVKQNFNQIAGQIEADLERQEREIENQAMVREQAPLPRSEPRDDRPDPVEAAIAKSRSYRASEAVPRREASQYVSAPVSREVPSSNLREDREFASGRVTLSVAEREIARSMGLSDLDYARGKLDMKRRKAAGDLQQ